jgi:hypothetical protein
MVAYTCGTRAVLSVALNTDPSTPSLLPIRSLTKMYRWERGSRQEVEGQQQAHHRHRPVWETPSTV